ncbi:hypothetical protein ABID26_007177 [Mesorhizobium shonense]|uniref:Uncharacterized protein n=1 Tax=Mesorhizobium shonense TaxID=1209948 RepID=A0ABV2I4S5_9HYPH
MSFRRLEVALWSPLRRVLTSLIGRRGVQANLGLHLDHTRGDLDEAQSQRVDDGKARFGIAARKPRISQ